MGHMPADQLITTTPTAATSHPGQPAWSQVHVEFADWPTAYTTATHQLRPLLDDLSRGAGWWFIRKHPCWRIRYRGIDDDTHHHLATGLDALVGDSTLRRWASTIYEPETLAFGGPAAIDIAHDLFCHDCRVVLDLLNPQAPSAPGPGSPGRTELSILAISRMLRGAGQDWFEQGDVWARVADIRGTPDPPPYRTTTDAPAALHRLLTLDTGPHSPLIEHGPLTPLTSWLTAFDDTGTRLAALASHGRLSRGLRAVLTHHVIFHWNRLGLPRHTQQTLADLARDVITERHGARTPWPSCPAGR